MAFEAKDPGFLAQQNKVQQLVIRFADAHLYTISGSDVIVDINETLSAVFGVLHFDNSVPGVVMVTAANTVVSGEQVTVTLAAAFAANDVLVLNYIVSE